MLRHGCSNAAASCLPGRRGCRRGAALRGRGRAARKSQGGPRVDARALLREGGQSAGRWLAEQASACWPPVACQRVPCPARACSLSRIVCNQHRQRHIRLEISAGLCHTSPLLACTPPSGVQFEVLSCALCCGKHSPRLAASCNTIPSVCAARARLPSQVCTRRWQPPSSAGLTAPGRKGSHKSFQLAVNHVCRPRGPMCPPAVAATTPSDTLAPFSNWGPKSVHLAAPGVGILSTVPWADTAYDYNRSAGRVWVLPGHALLLRALGICSMATAVGLL